MVPRSPLTVQQLRVLEEMIFKGPTLQDRSSAGYCVFLWLARARFSDAIMATQLVLDCDYGPQDGFVELLGSSIKSGTSAQEVHGVANGCSGDGPIH